MNVEAMLCPASIAVIGATEKSGFGRRALENLMSGDCGDDLYLVNPRREQVFGKKCYRSISEIGRKIDLAVICTPMAAVNDILREAGECGARAAVVYASGYGESGPEGRLAQSRLVEIAGEYGMAVCGPNCGGFINNVDGIYGFGLDMHGRRPDGNIGLVSQSGQICSMMASVTYMNFSYLISSGNCAVTGVEDYLVRHAEHLKGALVHRPMHAQLAQEHHEGEGLHKKSFSEPDRRKAVQLCGAGHDLPLKPAHGPGGEPEVY